MKVKPTAGIVTALLGALVVLIPTVLFPVCTNMIELANGKSLDMKCHWTAMAEILVGTLIFFNGILMIGFKKSETRLALSILLFLLGLSALLVTTIVIGMCATATMPCREGTEPALIVASVITMAVGIANVIVQSISNRKETK